MTLEQIKNTSVLLILPYKNPNKYKKKRKESLTFFGNLDQ